jgi:hypothetical protein
MSDFDIKFPWIRYGIGNKKDEIKDKMMELTTAVWSPFNGEDMAKVFIFCMAYGFAKGVTPEKPPGSASMPNTAFDGEMRNYMKFVAIAAKKDFEVGTNALEVVKICEGYAYAAFLDVYNKIKNRKSSIRPEAILEKLIKESSKQS